MKNTSFAAIALAAFATSATAQTSVTVYGAIDAGIAKVTDKTLAVTKRDANKLGFRGTEDLGNGLKALFQIEMRYEPDTGTVESGSRPLFQGQTRVGLQGDFGMLRIGRGVTAVQDAKDAFDPFNGISGTPGFKGDVEVAGYTSQPLDPAGSSNDRFNNAVWYNSPVMGGFALNVTAGTKEANGGAAITGLGSSAAPQYPANAEASANPFSVAGTYKLGMMAAMLGYERNAIETKLLHAGVSVNPMPELKLMATYARQDQGHTKAVNPDTKGWLVGANYTVGAGRVLFGYGQKTPDGAVKTKQASLGYEYNLSKRTFLYADVSDKKAATSVKYYGVGVHHNF
ncbi:porin [Massilia sp. R2A-15]|uniref:porin n=1 Tax=Massilia sp. R2A-15 TaxID=3064278 RepID=UPI0027366AC0|nr:porin [Massilia sp. R2A-15]WLI90313.1 porin [Massilia sp. R2A-15]